VEEIARRAFRNRGFLKSEAMFELLPPPQSRHFCRTNLASRGSSATESPKNRQDR